ncbi:MAG: leucine-rich repeat domain-containing protein, partial [Mycetocola sp.]
IGEPVQGRDGDGLDDGGPRVADDDELVTIPDAALRAALHAKTGSDEPTRGGLRRITTLNISGTDVSDLTGLEYATRLSDFEFNRTIVSSLDPISGLTGMRYLFAANTPLDSAGISALSGMPLLNYVSLNATEITDISAFSNALNLVRLEIANTRVSTLEPLKNSVTLGEIYFQNTEVSDVQPLSGLTALRTLSGPYTQVRSLAPVAGLQQLSILNVNGARVTDLSMINSWPALKQVGFRNQTVEGGDAFVSVSEDSYRRTDTSALFDMPDDGVVVPTDGAEPLDGTGALWRDVDPSADKLTALFSYNLERGATYTAQLSYAVHPAEYVDVPPAQANVGTPLKAQLSTTPGFEGGEFVRADGGIPGVDVDPSGALRGTPSEAGVFEYAIARYDGHGNAVVGNFITTVSGPLSDDDSDDDGADPGAEPGEGADTNGSRDSSGHADVAAHGDSSGNSDGAAGSASGNTVNSGQSGLANSGAQDVGFLTVAGAVLIGAAVLLMIRRRVAR